MNEIDALGRRPDRHGAFSRELLAEVDDEQLSQVVRDASETLGMPIALVSLVLEHIQFFKAQVGLPPDLACARATDRDVSFCQFVVRDGRPFEVSDALTDERIPRQLVETYGLRSYLGMPIKVGSTVVGSLCVLDTKPRDFDEADRKALADFAERVNDRLAEFDNMRRVRGPALMGTAAAPAVTELARILAPIHNSAGSGVMTTAALGSFLRLADHLRRGGRAPTEIEEASIETAKKALDEAEDAFFNIQANAADAEDCVSALRDVFEPSDLPKISQVIESARELARSMTDSIGGVKLPELERDSLIVTPRSLAVSLVSTYLTAIAARMTELGERSRIQLRVREVGNQVAVSAHAPLNDAAMAWIRDQLSGWITGDPTVTVESTKDGVELRFSLVRAELNAVELPASGQKLDQAPTTSVDQ